MSDYQCTCGGDLRRIGWQELARESGKGKKTAAQFAAEHLRSTHNPAVGWGDTGLLHQIADLVGMEHEGPKTEKKLLDRLERSHRGVLVKTLVHIAGVGNVRQYRLPEHAQPDEATG